MFKLFFVVKFANIMGWEFILFYFIFLVAELQQKGVMCVNNNRLVAASVHLLFLCVLPSQFPAVVEEIKDSLSSQ